MPWKIGELLLSPIVRIFHWTITKAPHKTSSAGWKAQ